LQNIVNFVYLLGMSVGQGVQIIVGNNVGAGNYSGARSINRLGIKLALASNLILGLLMAVFRDNLLGIFTSDLKIIAIAAPIIISI
jgi:Na+-driven multidrug efflux pump